MSAFDRESSTGSEASTETIKDFLKRDIFPNSRLLCSCCGTTAFFTNPGALSSCCRDGKGIDDFSSLKLHDDGTVVTTFSSSTTTLSPETSEEIEFVGTLRSYFQTSNEFSTPEERVLMLNALKELHYKSFLKAFKDANPESTMTVQEFRAMLENR
jgi:hypothetical protein